MKAPTITAFDNAVARMKEVLPEEYAELSETLNEARIELTAAQAERLAEAEAEVDAQRAAGVPSLLPKGFLDESPDDDATEEAP